MRKISLPASQGRLHKIAFGSWNLFSSHFSFNFLFRIAVVPWWALLAAARVACWMCSPVVRCNTEHRWMWRWVELMMVGNGLCHDPQTAGKYWRNPLKRSEKCTLSNYIQISDWWNVIICRYPQDIFDIRAQVSSNFKLTRIFWALPVSREPCPSESVPPTPPTIVPLPKELPWNLGSDLHMKQSWNES